MSRARKRKEDMSGSSFGVVSAGAGADAERSAGERSEPQRRGARGPAPGLAASSPVRGVGGGGGGGRAGTAGGRGGAAGGEVGGEPLPPPCRLRVLTPKWWPDPSGVATVRNTNCTSCRKQKIGRASCRERV